MNDRLEYHAGLLKLLAGELRKLSDSDQHYNQDNTIVSQLDELISVMSDSSVQQSDSVIHEGQQWLTRFMTHNPELAPAIHRDLLWFFGGDCLHFMPDDEIDKYQQLDEMEEEARTAGESFNRAEVRASLFRSH